MPAAPRPVSLQWSPGSRETGSPLGLGGGESLSLHPQEKSVHLQLGGHFGDIPAGCSGSALALLAQTVR